MNLLKKKVSLALFIACVVPLSLPYIFKLVDRVKYEMHLSDISHNCDQYSTGMSLMDFYEITGAEVQPDIRIEYSLRDSSYHHYISYPPPYNKEVVFKFEFDHRKKIIIEKHLPESCPDL